MCGIAGYVNLSGEPASNLILKKMTDAIMHRGPDGEGHFVNGCIGLGHRRLSIIDLSNAGRQPMITSDNRWVLSYNGEVYNYKELRNELKNKGIKFVSNTDTEVVLYALAIWGTDALLKFNGMFALALLDRKTNNILLARDRYGIKPLYYSNEATRFSFGSEQKAITALPNHRKIVNKTALIEYFTFQNIFSSNTLLNNISILEPGHYLIFNINDGSVKLNQYWDYNFDDSEQIGDKQEYLEELDRLFENAVNRQLASDVELGAYLSGGMDSGSITAIVSKKLENLKSFTCGFDLSSASGIELTFDERSKAEAMSAKFKTEHYQVILKSGDMERCLPMLAWHLEEPRVGQSYPNFYVANLASKFVKVVLSGCGGDELFGGYPWRYYRTLNAKNFDEYIDQYYLYWQRLVTNSELKKLFSPISNVLKDIWTRDIFYDVFKNCEKNIERPEDCINKSLYLEAKTFLHGLFVVEDKLSMAHSLESRVPFMDNELVEFACKCPVRFKINNIDNIININENEHQNKRNKYWQRTNDGKQILRDMMLRYIPKDIVEGEKQGFSSPDASWFKGESINFVRKFILNKNAHIYNFLDYSETIKLVNQHLNGEKNRRLLIWSLLNVETWLEKWEIC